MLGAWTFANLCNLLLGSFSLATLIGAEPAVPVRLDPQPALDRGLYRRRRVLLLLRRREVLP